MKKIREGDIFTIPIDSDQVGFGQVLCVPNKNNFIIVVYECRLNVSEDYTLKDIVEKPILFMGYTMDARLYHKQWRIIENHSDNISRVPLPLFKLGVPPGDIYLLDFAGNTIRPCTNEEFEILNYRKVIAPIRYEKAIQAFYGIGEWKKEYDEMKASNYLKAVKVIVPMFPPN